MHPLIYVNTVKDNDNEFLDPNDLHCKDENILQIVFVCVLQIKETATGLKGNEGEEMMVNYLCKCFRFT